MKVSLLPLDVGFDLRITRTEVHLPANVKEVYYLDREGRQCTAAGPIEEIVKELESYGYNVLNAGDGQ